MQKLKKNTQCEVNKFVLYCVIWCICKSYEEWLREVGFSRMEKRRLRKDFLTLFNYLEDSCIQVGVGLFSPVISNRTRGNGLK